MKTTREGVEMREKGRKQVGTVETVADELITSLEATQRIKATDIHQHDQCGARHPKKLPPPEVRASRGDRSITFFDNVTARLSNVDD
jgi:hypothetical protein